MYDPASQEWTQLTVPDTPKNPLISSVLVRDATVWFGGAEGVWRYSIADRKMHRVVEGLPSLYVNLLLSTDSGSQTASTEQTLWAGTRQGLARYDSTRQRWVPLSPRVEEPNGLGNLKKHPSKNTPTQSEQLPSPNVTALAFRDGILWIGTPRGLGSYTLASDAWHFPSNVPYNIRDILCAETDETLWLATDIGLVEYHYSYKSSVNSYKLREERNNQPEPLNQQLTTKNQEPIKIHQSRPVREPFLETKVSHIKFDGDYIWFTNWRASPNGSIVRFHRPTETWRRFTRLDILQSTQKRSMTFIRWTYVDTDAVWFTTDYGILRYDKISDTWQHFTAEAGLSTDDVNQIAVSEQSVWVIPMIGLEAKSL